MLSKKLLSIYECRFALPDNFNGTLGEALMLLAKYRLKSEHKNKTNTYPEPINCYEALQNDDSIQCAIAYSIDKLSEDGTKWEKQL